MASSVKTADEEAPEAPDTSGTRAATITDHIFRNPVLGPLGALIILIIAFSIFTDNFLSVDNTSLILQQSVVVGTLALGQTIIILTGGIDLANGAIMVLGSLVIARLATEGTTHPLAALVGILLCGVLGLISGLIISRLGLPPFIVTLGMLTILQSVSRLYTKETVLVDNGFLTFLHNGGYPFGQVPNTLAGVVVVPGRAGMHFPPPR